jgi:hypothetical protein
MVITIAAPDNGRPCSVFLRPMSCSSRGRRVRLATVIGELMVNWFLPARHQQQAPEPHNFVVRNFLNQALRPTMCCRPRSWRRRSSTIRLRAVARAWKPAPATILRARRCRVASCANVRDDRQRPPGIVRTAALIRNGCFHRRVWQLPARAVSSIGRGRSRARWRIPVLRWMQEYEPVAAPGFAGRAHQPGNDHEDEIHFAPQRLSHSPAPPRSHRATAWAVTRRLADLPAEP